MRTISCSAAIAALLTAGAAMAQDAGVKVGTLTCEATDITNVVLFTETNFDCVYESATGDTTESYTGEIDKIGLDLSIKDDVTMVWAVVAPTETEYMPKQLSGTYFGAAADASLGLGAGAHVLVGGGDMGFTLQPVSVEGIEGVGASLGIESFELE